MAGVGVACIGDAPSVAQGAVEDVVNHETEREMVVADGLGELCVPNGTATVHGIAFITAPMKHRQVGRELKSKWQRPTSGKSIGEICDMHILVGGQVAP